MMVMEIPQQGTTVSIRPPAAGWRILPAEDRYAVGSGGGGCGVGDHRTPLDRLMALWEHFSTVPAMMRSTAAVVALGCFVGCNQTPLALILG